MWEANVYQDIHAHFHGSYMDNMISSKFFVYDLTKNRTEGPIYPYLSQRPN
jgi:hypothetical protein